MNHRDENELNNKKELIARAGFVPWLFLGILPVFILYQISLGRLPFYMDNTMYFYPAFRFMAECVRAGDLPLWNPYQFCGFPFLSDPQSQLFYPGSLLLYILPFSLALRLEFLLHYALAGIGMYGWLRTLEIRRVAALSGALLFAWGGYMLPHLALIPLLFSAVWFPWVFWFLELSVRRKNAAWALAGGLILASSIYAGASQNAVYLVYGVALYSAWNIMGPGGRKGPWRPVYGLLMPFIVLASGIALAAAKLIPSWDFISISDRAGGLSLNEASQGILSWKTLLPALLGGTGVPEVADSSAYVGTTALVLAAAGCFHHKRRLVLFALSGLLLFIFISLGNIYPVYSFFFKFVPGFNISPAPKRIIIYAALLIPLLAALGIEHLWNITIDGDRKWIQIAVTLFVVAAAAVSSFLTNDIYTRYFGFVILVMAIIVWGISNLKDQKLKHLIAIIPVLILTDLLIMSGNYELQFAEHEKMFMEPKKAESIQFLKDQTDASSGLPPRFYSIDAITGSYSYNYRGTYSNTTLLPNMATYYGVSDCQGYGIKVQDYVDFVRRVVNEGRRPVQARYFVIINNPESRFLPMLGVDYVILADRSGIDLNAATDGYYEYEFGADDCKVYRLSETLPRAFLVYDDIVAEDRDATFDIIRNPGFDPGQSIVIDNPDLSLNNDEKTPETGGPPGRVRITEFSPDRIRLEVESPRPAWLALLETYTPGWMAAVNGEAADVVRGNFWHRAVKVPAGASEVEVFYQPPAVKTGLTVSLAALILWAVAFIAAIRIKSISKPGIDTEL